MPDERFERAVSICEQIRCLPYIWPGVPDAAAARQHRAGTCASKHALAADELDALGLATLPLLVVGPLVPHQLADDPTIGHGRDLLEVHELLTVTTPWAGPVRVDLTWDPPLVAHGLTGGPWDGRTDTPIAIGEPIGAGWAVPRDELRPAKQALRSRLSTHADLVRRDEVLAAMSERFTIWRRDEGTAPA